MKTKRIILGMLASAVLTGTLLTSCKEDEATLPPIGGFNSADDVASANLVAYWGMNGDNKESKSGTSPDKSENASYTTGIKGQALNLTNGYLRYPTIAGLNSANGFGSFTVSTWINTKNSGTAATSIFSLNEATAAVSDWGQLMNLMLETASYKATSDTLVLKGLIGQYAGGTREGHDNLNNFGVVGTDYQIVKGAGKWTQVVMKYDASTSTLDVYGNGTVVSNKNFRVRKDGKLGALVFPTSTTVLIGAFANQATGIQNSSTQVWQSMFNGQIDEIRVWNRALSDGDISSLYQLESAGR